MRINDYTFSFFVVVFIFNTILTTFYAGVEVPWHKKAVLIKFENAQNVFRSPVSGLNPLLDTINRKYYRRSFYDLECMISVFTGIAKMPAIIFRRETETAACEQNISFMHENKANH